MTLQPTVALIDAHLRSTIDRHVTEWWDRNPGVDTILEAHPGWTAEMLFLGAVLGQAMRGAL